MKIPVPVFLALCLWAGPANRCPAASPGDEIFREAEEAYLEGDFKLGGQKLEDLIASHPGDFDLASDHPDGTGTDHDPLTGHRQKHPSKTKGGIQADAALDVFQCHVF